MKTKEEIALNVVLSMDHEISAEQIILTPDNKKEGNCLNQLCKIIESALEEYTSQSKWVSVKEKPLYTKDDKGVWTCTEHGDGEFIAAVPYDDNGECRWWIRHCVVEDRIGLCVVTDDDTEKAGWDLEDVTHYQPLPSPPSLTD